MKLRTTALVGIFLYAGCGTPATRAQDAAALVKKMEAAYAGLKSYSQTTGATGRVVIEGASQTGGVSAQINYQAPNRLYLWLTNPAVGSVFASTDGKEQVIYFAKRNAYLRMPAPPTLKQFVEGLKRYQIVAVLDPLYFLTGEPASKLADHFVSKGQDKVNGVPCDKVVGTLRRNAAQTARSGKITFWIDSKTSLLQKTLLELEGVPIKTKSKAGAKSTPVIAVSMSDQSIFETVQKMQINPQLKENQLKVMVPTSAKLMRPPSR